MSARTELLSLRDAADPFARSPAELAALRLEAVRELFAERRAQISLLDRLARDNNVSEIGRLSDAVPVLFSHTTYKSYPHAFLRNKQWGRLQQWLAMVSVRSPIGVDIEGVQDVDDWIDRLWQAGHRVATTSATSGKVSLLPRNAEDHAFGCEFARRMPGWPDPIKPDNSRHFFMFGPNGGSYVAAFMGQIIADAFARPDSSHYLSNARLKVAEVSRMAELGTRIADGTATPSEVAAMKARSAEQSAASAARLDEMLETILSVRHEPMYIVGLWGQLWSLMQRARERGIAPGQFSPETLISTGGGTKGAALPPDYQEQILDFLGPVRTLQAYGMSEMSWFQPRCPANRYHQIPWVVPLLLDETGTQLIEADGGIAKGRFAFIDVSLGDRWGGLISGDQVEIDFSPVCPCGRHGPTILPTITRYSDLGDDRLTCAGTIDAYVKGAVNP
jgi:hypothetical protein